MEDIRFNFIELTNSECQFKIYRKEYDHLEQQDKTLFVYKLPDDKNPDEDFKSYLISFDPRDDFEEFGCSIWTNNELTKKWMFLVLIKNLEGTELNYVVSENRFNTTVDFVTNETPYGNQIISIIPYFLKIKSTYGFIIDFGFRMKSDVKFNKEVQRLSLSLDNHYRSNRNYYSDKFHQLSNFISNQFAKLLPLKVNDDELQFNLDLTILPSSKLDNKKYIFGNSKTSTSQFQGIKSHGPFRKIDQEVKYVFVFEDKLKSFGNDIFLSLTGKTNPGTFPGMEEMFKIPMTIDNITRIPITNLDVENLQAALNQIKDIRDTNSESKIITILLEENSVDENNPQDSPYFFLKYNLLKENIPLQVLSYEGVGGTNSLKWSSSNIGLQMFSKLGGTPWLVLPSNSKCLILGIGSSHKKDQAGQIHKYLAYSVCLDSSGVYKRLAVLSESENKEDYLSNLKNNLVSLLKESEFDDYRKVVLHIPFKIKKDEIRSIELAISEFSNIEFKVIKINTENKFFGFGSHNTYVPYESTYIKLSKSEYLVWFEGLQYGKEIVYQRIGNPVHIQFLNFECTSKDEDFPYLQDVLNLSGANWRGFNAKSIPISIYYSKLIADYTKVFENFSDFDRNIFSTSKPWFL